MTSTPHDFCDFDSYQWEAFRFVKQSISADLTYFALGLSGEVGEVNELIKKSRRDETVLDKDKLTKELGDVMYYLSQLAQCIGVELSDIAANSLNRLHSGTEL